MSNFHILQNHPNFRIFDCQYPANYYHSQHQDKISRISIVLDGQVKETLQQHTAYAKTASLVIKDANAYHANWYGPRGARIISIELQDEFADGIFKQELDNWKWHHGLPSAKAIFCFLQTLKNSRDETMLTEHLLALLATLPHDSTFISKHPPRWLSQLEEKIRDEYAQPLQTKDIAHEIGIHPVYLARVFRKFYATSIKQFLHQIRLERAIQDLNTPKSLSHIAFDNGFSDQSHFTRMLKKKVAMSPGELRQLLKNY